MASTQIVPTTAPPPLQPQGQQGQVTNPILGPRHSTTRTALARLLSDVIRTPAHQDQEKLHQYLEARLNNLYFRGKQYLATSAMGTLSDLRPSSDATYLAFTSKDAQAANPFLYDYILPIFSGDVGKLVSVIGTRSPNLKSAPIIPGRLLDTSISRIVDRGLAYLRYHLNLDVVTPQLALSLCNSGTTFSYISWNVDPLIYGVRQVPNPEPPPPRYVPEHEPYYECYNCGKVSSPVEVQENMGRCPNCSAPLGPESLIQSQNMMEIPGEPLPPITVPNGAIEIALESILSVDCPFNVKSPDLDDCPWIKREYEVLKYSLVKRYRNEMPELGQSLHNAPAYTTISSTYAADARQAQYNPSGTRNVIRDPNLWLSTELWLTPDMYEAIPNDQSGQISQLLNDTYPNGAKIAYVNSEPVAIYDEDLHRHWKACKPTLSEGIFGDPVFSSYRQGVDVLNDSLNMIIEALEHIPGEVMFDKSLLDSEYLKQNSPKFGAWVPVKFDGRSLGDHIARIPGADIHEGVIQFMDWYIRQIRESVGITPALFGGDQGGNKTAREVEIQRNQALQQHLIMWNNMRQFLSGTAENALQLLALKSEGYLCYKTKAINAPETEPMLDIGKIALGGFRVHAEESFPMSPGQRRDWIADQLANPALYPLLGLTEDPMITPTLVPQNMPLLAEALFLPDWDVPLRDMYQRMMEIVKVLLEQQPMEPMIDPYTGMPGPPQPSIQPDPTLFPPIYAIRILRSALLKDTFQMESEQNPAGTANVRAYLESYIFIDQQQQMQMAQMQGAAPGPGGNAVGGEGPGQGQGAQGSGSTPGPADMPPPVDMGPPPLPSPL